MTNGFKRTQTNNNEHCKNIRKVLAIFIHEELKYMVANHLIFDMGHRVLVKITLDVSPNHLLRHAQKELVVLLNFISLSYTLCDFTLSLLRVCCPQSRQCNIHATTQILIYQTHQMESFLLYIRYHIYQCTC